MKVNSKKLLSWLCVIAMVLSLAPVMDMSNFAVETNAATNNNNWAAQTAIDVQTNINNANKYQTRVAEFGPAEGATSFTAKCPYCGVEKEWLSLDADGDGKFDFNPQSSQVLNKHIYFKDNVDLTGKGYYKNDVKQDYLYKVDASYVCILLINATVTTDLNIQVSAGTLNLYGTGTITSTGDNGLFQLSGTGKLNLHGGNFVHTGNSGSAISMSGADNVVSIYPAATIGPNTQDTTKRCQNLDIADGAVRMYGGTIQNGVTDVKGTSGNVQLGASGVLNMFDGTIKGGTHLDTLNDSQGGNIFLVKGAQLNIYGGTVEGGNAKIGGNIYAAGTTTTNIYGGTIQDGNASSEGGNIYLTASSAAYLYFYGGTITNGKAGTYGGNVYTYANFTMEEKYKDNGIAAILSLGKAGSGGGNLYLRGSSAGRNFYIKSGTITGGEHTGSSGSGGNVFLRDGICHMSGGTITGGKAPGTGGNVYVYANMTFNMTGGVISRGYNTKTGAKTRTANVQVDTGGTFTLKEGVRLENQATLVDNEGYEALYTTDADALADYGNNTVYMTLAKNALTLNRDVVINTNGYGVALSGSGNVKLIDTANHNFETASGKVTVAGSVKITGNDVTVNDKRYITIKNGDDYSAHYVKMALTGIALRPSENGLYYKGQFECDNTLAGCVTQFGIAVSAVDENGNPVLPTDLENTNVKYSIYGRASFAPNEEHVVTAYGVLVYGILREVDVTNRTAQGNVDYMQMAVNANPYMKIDTGIGEEPITVMAYGENDAPAKYGNKSLLQVVTRIDTLLSKNELDASDEAMTDMVDFANYWIQEKNMGSEGVEDMRSATANIRNWTSPQAVS